MTVSDDHQHAIMNALSSLNAQLRAVGTQSIPGLDRILASRGKRQRPKLLFAIVLYSGKPIDKNVVNAACSVELVHLASLIHDDILDKGTVRRGVQTISAVEGPDIALLAGDYLLAQACTIAARIDATYGQIVADTIIAMCKGQAEEIASRYNIQRRPSELMTAIQGKTASLFAASATLGGMLVEATQIELDSLVSFARNFGLAYQLQDDIQDFFRRHDTTDKTASFDYEEGNYTLPLLLALRGPDNQQFKQLLAQTGSHHHIVSLLDKGRYFARAQAEVLDYQNKAKADLNKLSNKELATFLLRVLDDAMIGRS